jgi:hypothetical protein
MRGLKGRVFEKKARDWRSIAAAVTTATMRRPGRWRPIQDLGPEAAGKLVGMVDTGYLCDLAGGSLPDFGII